MGIGIGAIAGGIRQGLKDYRDNMRAIEKDERDDVRFKMEQERFGLEKERVGREAERFGWERKQEEERERIRQAEAEYRGADEALRNGQILGPEGVAEVPAAPGQTAIAPPGVEPGAAPKPPNPFMSGAEKYKDPKAALDTYYQRKGDALAKLYNARGEFEKAEKVPSMIRALRQEQWTEKTGAALAALASGAPGALDAMQKVYGMVSDGYDLDPSKGRYDPKTQTWQGLERIDQKTGERQAFNLTTEQIATMAMRYKDPGELIKFTLDRADQYRKDAREDRKVGADEKRAEADMVRANAYAATAGDNARTNASTRETNAEIKKRQQEAREDDAAVKLFNGAFGYREVEPKTKDEIAEMTEEGRKQYAEARREQSRRREAVNYATTVFSINERQIAPSVITQVLPALQRRAKEGKPADGIDEKTGLPFVNFNGKKILLPKD